MLTIETRFADWRGSGVKEAKTGVHMCKGLRHVVLARGTQSQCFTDYEIVRELYNFGVSWTKKPRGSSQALDDEIDFCPKCGDNLEEAYQRLIASPETVRL